MSPCPRVVFYLETHVDNFLLFLALCLGREVSSDGMCKTRTSSNFHSSLKQSLLYYFHLLRIYTPIPKGHSQSLYLYVQTLHHEIGVSS